MLHEGLRGLEGCNALAQTAAEQQVVARLQGRRTAQSASLKAAAACLVGNANCTHALLAWQRPSPLLSRWEISDLQICLMAHNEQPWLLQGSTHLEMVGCIVCCVS